MALSQLAALTVSSERFHIAPLRAGDEAALKAVTDDPGVTGAISFLKSPFTLEDAAALIRSNTEGSHVFLGVRRNDNEALVGVVGVHPRSPDGVELGYWFATIGHGHGYATEAVGAVIRAVQAAVADRIIYAECPRDNRASWRVLEKLGFTPTGRPGVRPGREQLELNSPLP